MSVLLQQYPSSPGSRLRVELATTLDDIHASQALRYRVFAEELGAAIDRGPGARDEDRFDAFCQHLLVRECDSGRIVGSTRLLLDAKAERAGGFYSTGEFDISALLALPGRRLEVGRTCIDPGYRQGAAIAVLWSGLAEFIKTHRIGMMFGCASVAMHDGGAHAQAIMNRVRQHALTGEDCRVQPKCPLPALPPGSAQTVSAPLPPLLKAYFRAGARACGEPCHDPAFNCADILVLVKVVEMDASYTRHFIDRIIDTGV